MSLAFDTGLPRSLRETIVNALAGKLAELKRPTKYLQAVITIPEMIGGDEEGLADLARAANGRVPCVAIAMGGKKPDGGGLEAIDAITDLEFGLYVVSGNARGAVDGRLFVDAGSASSDTLDPGVFAMLEHIEERIWGANLAIEGVGTPRQTGEDQLWSGDDATIWFQTYRVQVERSIKPNRAVTAVLTSIEARHKGDGITPGSSLDPFITTISALEAP